MALIRLRGRAKWPASFHFARLYDPLSRVANNKFYL